MPVVICYRRFCKFILEGDKQIFRIAICDDESFFRKRMRDILTDYMEEKGVLYEIDEFESGKEFISLGIEIVKYKIVFLDINMDEMDGMETAKIILFILVLVIKIKIGDRSSEVLRDSDWLRFIFFPVFSIFTIIAMINTSGSVKNQKQENVFLVIALCLAGMNIVVFYLINDILKREIKIRENEIFRLKVRNQTDMYRSISESFDKQRKMTHEYKNQIMCIETLIAAKNYDELEEYVSKVSGHLRKELDYIKTNNVIVDAILNSKYREMLDKNIVFIFKINDLSDIIICDEDIVVILSNLLNNAIEAVEKCPDKKIIKMKFIQEKDNIIISVKNTYDGELVISEGEIQTSKKNEIDEHGIGLKNIIDIITKYQGFYVIQNDENEFYFSIIIPHEKK